MTNMQTLEISVVRNELPDYPDAHPGDTRSEQLAEIPSSTLMQPERAIPDPLSFAPMIDPRLKIRKSFKVRFHRCESGMTAYAEEIEEFGQGANSSEALIDLGKTIAELFFSLDAEADRLAAGLWSLRERLTEHIERVHR